MTERTIDALSADAIATSEREFFAEAMGHPEPESTMEAGDRSLEQTGTGLEGQIEADDEPAAEPDPASQVEKPEPEPKGKDRAENGRFKAPDAQPGKDPGKAAETSAERGLRAELTTTRDKLRAAEQDRDRDRQEMDRRFAALEQQLKQAQPPQAKPEPAKEEIPDRWTDPDGYDRYREDKLYGRFQAEQQSRRQQEVRYSFQDAQAKHGETFTAAYQAINALDPANPQSKTVLDYVMNARDPGAALLQVYQRSQAQREIGSDPAAYRQRVLDEQRAALMKDPEFRKSVLETLNDEARQAGNGSAKPLTNLPPSLNSARGGSVSRAAAGGESDRELFNEAFGR